MPTLNTHFEQVPLELVAKIVEEQSLPKASADQRSERERSVVPDLKPEVNAA